jgi:hypothetical protein
MRYILTAIDVLVVLTRGALLFLGIALPVSALADMTMYGTNVPPVVFGGAYTGPGEISGMPAASYWYSCFRGYTQFYASGGNPGCTIRRNDNNMYCDVLIAANGTWGKTSNCSSFPDNGKTAATFCTGTTCFVQAMYDQTGNGQTIMQTSNNANQAQLLFSGCGGALAGPGACVDCSTGGTTGTPYLTNSGAGDPQIFEAASPVTVSGVVLGVNATGGAYWAPGSPNAVAKFTSTPALDVNAGADATLAASFNTWYSVKNVISPNDGSASTIRANGTTSSTQNAGNGLHFGSSSVIQVCGDPGTVKAFNGKMTEIGFWPVALTGTQQGNLESNERTFWGF